MYMCFHLHQDPPTWLPHSMQCEASVYIRVYIQYVNCRNRATDSERCAWVCVREKERERERERE